MWPIPPIDAALARSIILLFPVIGLGVAFLIKPPTFFQSVGMLLGILWNIPIVLLLNILAQAQGWWHFAPSPNAFYGVPIELILGWAIFWGALLPFTFDRLSPLLPLLLALFLDLLLMPQLSMLFTLGEQWLIGEALLLLGALLPALIAYHLTASRQAVFYRALLQAAIWGSWNVFLIPAMILSIEGKDIFAIFAVQGWRFTIFFNAMALAIILGYVALYEFAKIGGGTPLPFDPPQTLVTTGPYAYVANPLQISALLMFLGIAIGLQSMYMIFALITVLIFSETFARWHHQVELAEKFSAQWADYKHYVRNWFPRWKPYIAQPSTVYFSHSCEICQDTEHQLQKLKPVGIHFTSAAAHPSKDLDRVTFRHANHPFEEDGINAIARVLEQCNLSFAFVGWVMRLPLLNQVLQIIVDGSAEKSEPVSRSSITTTKPEDA